MSADRDAEGIIEQVDESLDHDVAMFISILLMSFALAWPLMLAFGILHHQWSHVPAWSYLETYVLTVAVAAIRSIFR